VTAGSATPLGLARAEGETAPFGPATLFEKQIDGRLREPLQAGGPHTAVTPAGSGAVAVTVSTPEGTSDPAASPSVLFVNVAHCLALRRPGDVVVVQTGGEAKSEVLKRIPEDARIHSGKSKTLGDIGLYDTLMGSDQYDFVRKHTMKRSSARFGLWVLAAIQGFG
jgi:hypothetical protein